MQKLSRFDFSQQYIEHGYIELCIPPTADGQFAMETNYLHIWPRGSFMMIALPNLDRSYTVTLFMPFERFEAIRTHGQLIQFFETNFPDAIPLIGRESLITTFFSTPPAPLVSVKCRPYHYQDRVLILGDAAHAMVPFYGQGMNCGFEDCLLLDELLQERGNRIGKVLPVFTERRVEDCQTIVDLAMYNYIEMRDLVNSRPFLMRKKLDGLLHWLLPKTWVPLYSMVTFSRLPYSKCLADCRWQNKVLSRVETVFGITVIGCLVYLEYLHRPAIYNNWFDKSSSVDQLMSLIPPPREPKLVSIEDL